MGQGGEADLVRRGGRAAPARPGGPLCRPAAQSPAEGPAGRCRPGENCGNVDAKQLTKGSRLLIPVNVPGALYSCGDGHFAQGDSECLHHCHRDGRHRRLSAFISTRGRGSGPT